MGRAELPMAERYAVVDLCPVENETTTLWCGREKRHATMDALTLWLAELPAGVVVFVEGPPGAVQLVVRSLRLQWRADRRMVSHPSVESIVWRETRGRS